jgi:RNA polymerase sigma-70 factor (ECF subfamily)
MVGTVIWRATGDSQIVEDLSQEAFIRVFAALPSFDGRAKLSTWVYTIAHRVAIDYLRKTGRWRTQSFSWEEEEEQVQGREILEQPAMNPETLLFRNETVQFVRNGLRELPDKYRIPLVYSAIEGLDYSAISEILQVPVGTVKTLVFRGKKLLRQQIVTMARGDVKGGKST